MAQDQDHSPPDRLRRLFELCALISSSIDVDDVLERIMTASRQALDAETC